MNFLRVHYCDFHLHDCMNKLDENSRNIKIENFCSNFEAKLFMFFSKAQPKLEESPFY